MNLDEVEERLAPSRKGGTKLRIFPGDGDHRHGTENGYNNLGCTCPECTEAHRQRRVSQMNRKRAKLQDPPTY